MKRLLLLLSALWLAGTGFAQSRTVTFAGAVMDSDMHRVEAAEVELIVGTDTLHAVSSMYGDFAVKTKPGDALLRVTHIAYKPYEQSVTISADPRQSNWQRIWLEPLSREIDEVTVKGEPPLFKRSGDTLVYNAAAIKSLESDHALQIIEQLPGVLVQNGALTAMGQEVARTYVDGKLIFGENPMTALLNLTASDVQKIRIYDEDDEYHRKHGLKSSRKRRVLDIRTHSKLINALSAVFLASGGADLEKNDKDGRRERYGIGLTSEFFSEKLSLSAGVNANNIGRPSNRPEDLLIVRTPVAGSYAATSSVSASYRQRFGDEQGVSPELSANYTYSTGRTKQESHTSRLYFPTAEYAERSSFDSLYRARQTETHHAAVYFSRNFLSFSQSFETSRNKEQELRNSLALFDGTRTGSESAVASDTRTYKYSSYLNWNGRIAGCWHALTSAELTLDKSDGVQDRSDTFTDFSADRLYHTAPVGRARKLSGTFSLSYRPENEKTALESVEFGYNPTYEYERKRQLRYDLVRDELDIPGSRDMTYDYFLHRPYCSIRFRNSLMIDLPVEIAVQHRDERLPGSEENRKRFAALLPRISWLIGKGFNRRVWITYVATTTLPSMEQLSTRVDNSNPLYLFSGNPHLKQSVGHRFTLQRNCTRSNGDAWSVHANVSFHRNSIVDRSVFCKTATVLPDRNGFEVPAGGTFTTYENLNGALSASVSGEYSLRIKALRSNMRFTLSGDYQRTPTYVGEQRNRTTTYSPRAMIMLNSNFSRKVRLSLASSSSLIFSENRIGNDSRYLNERIMCALDSNFAKRLFFNSYYVYSLYKPLGSIGSRNENSQLNMIFGCRFHKSRGTVSLAGYDLLNRSTAFTTKMAADYQNSSWRSTAGRYWCVNVSYSFNKSQSGAAAGMRR